MKHRRTREIIIELTSLLDVVMILIFAVLLQNAELLDKKNQEIAGIEAENTGLLENISGLQDRLEALEGDNDKLSQELQEALDKINQGKVDELMAQLDKYENQMAVMEAIKDYVYVYYITTGRPVNADFQPTEITYGPLNGEETTVSINKTDKEAFADCVYNAEYAIAKYIEKNLTGNTGNKYFYVVIRMDTEKNYTYAYDYINKSQLEQYLKNRFPNNQHIYVVTKN